MSQIIIATGSAPSTPAAGKVSLYAKSTDKKLYFKDENGSETPFSGNVLDYGQRTISHNTTVTAITAAGDATLYTNGDYIQVTGIWDAIPSGLNQNITQQTNSLKIINAGDYEVSLWTNVTSSVNNTNIAFKFAVNGTITLVRRPRAKIGTGGDIADISAYGFTTLAANDVVSLWVAADNNANLTIQDCVFSVKALT